MKKGNGKRELTLWLALLSIIYAEAGRVVQACSLVSYRSSPVSFRFVGGDLALITIRAAEIIRRAVPDSLTLGTKSIKRLE